MKQDKRFFYFKEPVYASDMLVMVDCDWNFVRDHIFSWDKVAGKTLTKKEDHTAGMYMNLKNSKGASASLLWLREAKLPVLVHEIVHAGLQQMRHCNIRINHHNEETFARYVECMYKEITKRYKFK